MKRTFEQHWEEIEENFDWKKVYRVMKLLDWTWGMSEEASIPGIERIKKAARERCYGAFTNESGYSGSGGFLAQYKDGCLDLKFVVEEWSTYDPE